MIDYSADLDLSDCIAEIHANRAIVIEKLEKQAEKWGLPPVKQLVFPFMKPEEKR